MDKIAVLIPCYNESSTVAKVVSDFRAALPEAVIYVYDNNSSDGTDKVAEKAGAIVRYEHQQGKGNVIRRMFSEIDAQCYLMVDGDDYLMPNMLEKMYRAISDSVADICVCDWFNDKPFEYHKKEMVVYKKSEFMPPILLDSWPSVTWNKLIRKNCLDGVEFPPKMVAQDIGVMHLIFNNAEKIVFE